MPGSAVSGLTIASALAALSLRSRVKDGLARWFKLASEIGQIAASADQFDHLPAELGGIMRKLT
jgi:hypothetical protein